MPRLTDLVEKILLGARFHTGLYGTLSASQVRALNVQSDQTGRYMTHAEMTVGSGAPLAALVERLGCELQAYVEPETQRIGTGLVGLMGGVLDLAEPTLTEFARTFVKAAAILGSARAVQILRGWVAGEDYRYRIKVLLTGLRCDQPLSLEEGVQVTQLPTGGYSSDLAPHLPYSVVSRGTDLLDLAGRALLSINGTAGPALYRPSRAHGDQPDWNLRQVWAGGRIPCLMTEGWRERFTEALSLACDCCVRWTHIWRDVGDLAAFNFGPGHEFRDVSPGGDAVRLRQEHLETARDLDVQRHARAPSKSLDMAIKRWVGSKRPYATLADRFIDLRIAFEALYLPRSRSELRFRLALLGAWHLGADFDERRQYYDLLRKAYDRGSEAVHTGAVKDRSDNRDTLAAAQRACRTAIMKRLAESEKPAWDEVEVALGAPTHEVFS